MFSSRQISVLRSPRVRECADNGGGALDPDCNLRTTRRRQAGHRCVGRAAPPAAGAHRRRPRRSFRRAGFARQVAESAQCLRLNAERKTSAVMVRFDSGAG